MRTSVHFLFSPSVDAENTILFLRSITAVGQPDKETVGLRFDVTVFPPSVGFSGYVQ